MTRNDENAGGGDGMMDKIAAIFDSSHGVVTGDVIAVTDSESPADAAAIPADEGPSGDILVPATRSPEVNVSAGYSTDDIGASGASAELEGAREVGEAGAGGCSHLVCVGMREYALYISFV